MGLRDKARESSARADEVPEHPEEPQEPSVAPEEPAEEAPRKNDGGVHRLEPSVTYLVEEERPEIAYSLFLSELAEGKRGMIVSRTYPKNLRKAFKLKEVPVLWLTNAMSDEAVGPKDLERLTLTIKRFLEEGGGNLVLIDSLEYLITNNKFASVMRLLQTLRDMVTVQKAVCIVSLKSSTLEPSKLGPVERELEVYSPDESRPIPQAQEVENRLMVELKQDEVIIEAEKVQAERAILETLKAQLGSDRMAVDSERRDLDKERQEVKQTLLKVRQTRKELEDFRIKLTKDEAELTSKVRTKLSKEMQALETKKANLQAVEKEIESRYLQLDKVVSLKTEQRTIELQNEARKLEVERTKLVELTTGLEVDRRSVDERLAGIRQKEAELAKDIADAVSREKALQEKEHTLALDKVEFEKERAAVDSERKELDRLKKSQEQELTQMRTEAQRTAAEVSQRERSPCHG